MAHPAERHTLPLAVAPKVPTRVQPMRESRTPRFMFHVSTFDAMDDDYNQFFSFGLNNFDFFFFC